MSIDLQVSQREIIRGRSIHNKDDKGVWECSIYIRTSMRMQDHLLVTDASDIFTQNQRRTIKRSKFSGCIFDIEPNSMIKR